MLFIQYIVSLSWGSLVVSLSKSKITYHHQHGRGGLYAQMMRHHASLLHHTTLQYLKDGTCESSKVLAMPSGQAHHNDSWDQNRFFEFSYDLRLSKVNLIIIHTWTLWLKDLNSCISLEWAHSCGMDITFADLYVQFMTDWKVVVVEQESGFVCVKDMCFITSARHPKTIHHIRNPWKLGICWIKHS